MRRIVVAFVLVAAVLALTACGGSDSAGTTTSAAPAAAAPVAVPPAATAPADKSPTEVAADEQFPTQADSVPQAVLDRLTAKQPMLIFFYDSTQIVTNDQRTAIDSVTTKYRGLIDLVAYDVRADASAGGATPDPEVRKAMEMAGLLGVKFQPYTLFVDRYGRITGRFSGFVDAQLLEREVLRATS